MSDGDFDHILCVCCEEAVPTSQDYALGGPVCGECSVHLRNAQDALRDAPGVGGWSDICRENGDVKPDFGNRKPEREEE